MATSREPSAAPSSTGDTIDDQAEDVKPQIADLEGDDQSNIDVAAAIQTPETKIGRRGKGSSSTGKKSRPKKGTHIWISEGPPDGTEDEGSVVSTGNSRAVKKSEGTPDIDRTIGTAVGTRRQANGTVGSVYSGSKIRHIKKPDGTPLWRKEIQFEFLRLVIEDTTPVFTRVSDRKKECNFADIYIDCMARSSKTSKVLKERLQVDRQAAQNMAMICLLVNVGRMNTTLNFFPEMRAQLRTYHSIPSLQAYKSQKDYKSLQDAPRLKSILKGASEDTEEPRSVAAIEQRPVPRTNPVNLIFVVSQYAPKVSETHFPDKVDFFDLTMRSTISSASRARAFLWLMWWYLESDFSKEAGLNNPFGPGEYREGEDPEDPKTVPMLVPSLVHITEEEGDAENVDPEEEKEFAEKMSKERKRLMSEVANEPPLTMADPDHKIVKRLKKNAAIYGDDDSMISDVDSRASPGLGRSPAPDTFAHGGHAMSSILGGQADSLDDDWEAVDPHPGRGRYKRVRGKNTPSRIKGTGRQSEGGRSLLKHQRTTGTPELRSTPQPLQPGIGHHPVISQYGAHRGRHEIDALRSGGNDGPSTGPSKPRARTGYQRELEEHRNRRVEWALRRRRRHLLKDAKKIRVKARWLLRTARRVSELPPTYDSEEEEEGVSFGLGGMLGHRWTGDPPSEGVIPPEYEEDDYGEEAEAWMKVLKRTGRRLEVWDGDRDLAVYSARVQASRSTRGMGAMNGVGKRAGLSMKRDGRDLDDQITQDLLAERSDEEMMDNEDGDESGEGEGEADGEESEMEMD